jgi:competence protein ComEA
MSDLLDLPDQSDPDDDLLARPLPPRTWRDRLDDLAAGGQVSQPGRLVVAVVALVVVAVVGWRLLAPPSPPPEVQIPLAEPAAAAAAAAPGAVPGADSGAPGASTDPSAAPPGAATPGAAAAGPGVAAGEVVVHVVGAVVAPGVQRLPSGARVVDAVDAAGGAAPDADLGRINLAAALVDGQQVYVLRAGEIAPLPPAGGGDGSADADGGAGGASGGLVDINRASAVDLEELPGVGPVTAEAIIAHRDQHGPFTSVDDLIDVRGIGEAKLEQLRAQATV